MSDAESVVESVQTDAATEAAVVVAETSVAATSVVAAEVAEVASDLQDHAEDSEERHEEILGDTEWIRIRLELLSSQNQAMQTELAALRTLIQSEFQTLRMSLSPDTNQSTLPESTTVIAATVEPESAEGESPVAKIVRRKGLRKI